MSGLNGGLAMLKGMLLKLPDSEKKAAAYILENPREVVRFTINDLADKSGTSNAAIIRLCHSLGLKGFQDLKLRIAGDVMSTSEVVSRDIYPNETTDLIIRKMTGNGVQAIRDTAGTLSVVGIESAVEAIVNAKNIHFFGLGSSMIIAMDAVQKLQRVKKNAAASVNLHQLAVNIANMEKEDVLFAVSFSGYTEEVQKALQLGKQYGVKSISLTGVGSNPVSDLADIRLFVTPLKEAMFRSGATSSRIAMLHAMDILFMSIATRDYENTIKYIDETRSAIKNLNN